MNLQTLKASKLLVLLACLACSHTALAVTRTWDGSSSGNWATAANWSSGIAPVAGDDLVFPAGITRLLTTNNFSPNLAFNSITFLGSNYFLHGSALILTNGIRMGTPGGNNANPTTNTIVADVQVNASQSFFVTNVFSKLEVRGGVALGSRTLTFDGSGNQHLFGVISGVGGAVNKDGFGIVNFETNNSFTGGCLIFGGRIRAKQPLSLGTTAGGTTVHSGGMLELQANVTNEFLTLSGGTLFNNRSPGRWAGTINVVSNSSVLASGDFFIDGALTGAANLSVDASDSGLRADVTLTRNGDNTFTGTLKLLEGVLVLSKPSPNTALDGPLIVGDAVGSDPTNAVVL